MRRYSFGRRKAVDGPVKAEVDMVAGIRVGDIRLSGGIELPVGGADIIEPLAVGAQLVVEFRDEPLAGVQDIFEDEAGCFGMEAGLLSHVQEIGFVAEVSVAGHGIKAGVVIFACDDSGEKSTCVMLEQGHPDEELTAGAEDMVDFVEDILLKRSGEFMEDHFQDNLMVGLGREAVFEESVVDIVKLLVFRESGQHFFPFIDLKSGGFEDIVMEVGCSETLAVFEEDATISAADIQDTGLRLSLQDIEEDIEVEWAGGMNFGEIDITSVVIILH